MVRVHIICEGQTEETFINEVLMPDFSRKGIYLYPALIGRPGHKGGNVKYSRMKTDIENRLNDLWPPSRFPRKTNSFRAY